MRFRGCGLDYQVIDGPSALRRGCCGLEAIDVSYTLSVEERDTLDRFKRDELRSAAGAGGEMKAAGKAARQMFDKTKRVGLRVTERDFSLVHSRAREDGIP